MEEIDCLKCDVPIDCKEPGNLPILGDDRWIHMVVRGEALGQFNVDRFQLVLFAVGINAFMVIFYENATQDTNSIVWVCLVGAAILMIFYSTMTLFHSRVGCKPWQLLRNGIVVAMFNPLQAIINAVLMWAPLIVFLLDVVIFIYITPLWLLGYYSIVSYFTVRLFRVPFQVLLNNYNEVNGITDENTSEDEAEEDYEEN